MRLFGNGVVDAFVVLVIEVDAPWPLGVGEPFQFWYRLVGIVADPAIAAVDAGEGNGANACS